MITLNLYTQADADALSRLLDLTGVVARCEVIRVDPVNKPDAYLWHFVIEEV
jgi:hypothetical protein